MSPRSAQGGLWVSYLTWRRPSDFKHSTVMAPVPVDSPERALVPEFSPRRAPDPELSPRRAPDSSFCPGGSSPCVQPHRFLQGFFWGGAVGHRSVVARPRPWMPSSHGLLSSLHRHCLLICHGDPNCLIHHGFRNGHRGRVEAPQDRHGMADLQSAHPPSPLDVVWRVDAPSGGDVMSGFSCLLFPLCSLKPLLGPPCFLSSFSSNYVHFLQLFFSN